MQIHVNGEQRTLDGPTTIAGLLAELGLAGRRLAVEVNREIVPRGRHEERVLVDGDRVELVQAMGGG